MPLGNDDLVFSYLSEDDSEKFSFGDIVAITWTNHTTNEGDSQHLYITNDPESDESPFPLIRMLFEFIGHLATLEVHSHSRFLNTSQNSNASSENSSHSLTIEFSNVIYRPTDSSSPSYDIRESCAEHRRLLGNHYYGTGDYSKAIKSYSNAVTILENGQTLTGASSADTVFKCLNNLAASHMQLDQYRKAQSCLEKVEKIDGNNIKMCGDQDGL